MAERAPAHGESGQLQPQVRYLGLAGPTPKGGNSHVFISDAAINPAPCEEERTCVASPQRASRMALAAAGHGSATLHPGPGGGLLGEELLVVLLGAVEVPGVRDERVLTHGRPDLVAQPPRAPGLVLRVAEDCAPVLGAREGHGHGRVLLPEDAEDLLVGELARVELHPERLRVVRYGVVRGPLSRAPAVANHGAQDAWGLVKGGLRVPESPEGEGGGLGLRGLHGGGSFGHGVDLGDTMAVDAATAVRSSAMGGGR
eukprot:CAMPEP_0206013680 /NCGR_PEP_ID=MMETSP1464-20131121/16910_1 /ASSEMBLY_ACC=CAM_ASM_001124 /TAXON_ID=119497 /ORGANISM="Exanthemachrysis gayraliae, Strain RCC1523" /LENGTH=256 /DNA_ID=CAMNT_0053387409 /DNA_START=205 /DNA_END=973 /DNA_ORIENTATION=-